MKPTNSDADAESYIMDKLSFPRIHGLIQKKLKEYGLYSHPFLGSGFICSDKDKIGLFSGDKKTRLLSKLKRETGVHVREVKLSQRSREEKGVDMTVFVRMLHYGRISPVAHIVLFASDRDYVPALAELNDLGIHTIVVGFPTLYDEGKKIEYPIDLINEGYLYINFEEILSEMNEMISKTDSEDISNQQKA